VNRPRLAVVGAGVSGLTAAYLLQRRYDVTLYEADSRLGGHAHTHELATSDGGVALVDSGFIVHNERTYPNLLRLFGELGVATQESEMSMSVSCEGCGLEYAGARRLGGLFPGRRGGFGLPANLGRPRYLRMLAEIPRFHRGARRLLAEGDADAEADALSLGEFLRAGGYSRYFVDHFVLPVVSAVWSAGAGLCLDYPARYLFRFLEHHGLLGVAGSPTWRTVVGGSREYVQRAAKGLTEVQAGAPVRSVRRTGDGVLVRDDGDTDRRFDHVVIATHPDQALALLADPTTEERTVLGAFRYSRNETWLHGDTSVLPRAAGAMASWNYRKASCRDTEAPVLVSYHMNRLQRLAEPVDYVVTLNGADRVDPSSVLARMTYEHPVYTRESVAAQRLLPTLDTARTAYAGAYHGWGFHEDGCASGVRAAGAFGVAW
jgi:predicted NAD/FAD-binding protein